MRAVWYDRQGAADEVLVCGELPTPEAGHGEVRVKLEASGGVTLATLRAVAETGVDRVSVGALTHSAPALDIALDYEAP